MAEEKRPVLSLKRKPAAESTGTDVTAHRASFAAKVVVVSTPPGRSRKRSWSRRKRLPKPLHARQQKKR
ncbi:hypothetical protein EAO66_27610 [Klebsiella pneumoniae]|nr:hypothetical protein [Klebsiella pneumoniae]RRF10847.1 hypothetical protein EAO66_27610 [Klebsiella pneumoniae]